MTTPGENAGAVAENLPTQQDGVSLDAGIKNSTPPTIIQALPEVDQHNNQILDNVEKIMQTPRMNAIIKNVVANSTPPPAQSVESLGGDIDGNAPPATVPSVPGGLPAAAADNNNTPPPVKEKLYDIDGVPGTEKEKHIYTNLGGVNAARIEKNLDPLSELTSGGRRRTKHKKHHKKGGKKSHKKGKSSKKVAKRRKSRKTGSRRSRKQNKH